MEVSCPNGPSGCETLPFDIIGLCWHPTSGNTICRLHEVGHSKEISVPSCWNRGNLGLVSTFNLIDEVLRYLKMVEFAHWIYLKMNKVSVAKEWPFWKRMKIAHRESIFHYTTFGAVNNNVWLFQGLCTTQKLIFGDELREIWIQKRGGSKWMNACLTELIRKAIRIVMVTHLGRDRIMHIVTDLNLTERFAYESHHEGQGA